MSLPLKQHMIARAVLLLGGFVAGFAAFVALSPRFKFSGAQFLMPVFALVAAYLAETVFRSIVHAECPSCGADTAVPCGGKNIARYACTSCGVESNVMQPLLAAQIARAEAASAVAGGERRGTPIGWWFLFLGTLCIGVAAWNGSGSIRLVREGVSTEAKILSIKQDWNRHSKEHEALNIALIEYNVDGKPLTLERSWSADHNTSWSWPNYHLDTKLRVIYLPSDPSRASIHSLPELFLLPMIFGLVGLILAAVGVLLVRGWSRD